MQLKREDSEFDKSVWDIVGIADYEPRTLPQWFRDACLTNLPSLIDEDISDVDLVELHVSQHRGSNWVKAWGTAVIHDAEVFICETQFDPRVGFFDQLELAELLEGSVMLVERNRRGHAVGTTMYFTEFRVLAPRRNTNPEPCAELNSAIAV